MVKRIRLVKDLNGKSRGYAFIEYEHKNDFKNAYKRADRKRIDNKRVYVDYERGRTENNWKPRRFGGGKGDSRRMPSWLEREVKQVKEHFPEISKKYRKNEFLNKKRSRSKSKSNEDKKSIESHKNSFDNNNNHLRNEDNPSLITKNDEFINNNHPVIEDKPTESIRYEEIPNINLVKQEVNEEMKDAEFVYDEKKEKNNKKEKKKK